MIGPPWLRAGFVPAVEEPAWMADAGKDHDMLVRKFEEAVSRLCAVRKEHARAKAEYQQELRGQTATWMSAVRDAMVSGSPEPAAPAPPVPPEAIAPEVFQAREGAALEVVNQSFSDLIRHLPECFGPGGWSNRWAHERSQRPGWGQREQNYVVTAGNRHQTINQAWAWFRDWNSAGQPAL